MKPSYLRHLSLSLFPLALGLGACVDDNADSGMIILRAVAPEAGCMFPAEADLFVPSGHIDVTAAAGYLVGPEVRNDLTLVLMVAQRNDALEADLRALTLHEEPIAPGYARLHGAAFSLLLVDLTELARHERDDFVPIFAAGVEPSAEASSWWYAHRGIKDKAMDPTQLEGFKDLERRFIQSVPVEERLAGLAPEERLVGLPPEQTILALPDAILARLPESFLVTLSEDVQAAVRARLRR